jgi:hypothetical protein
MINLWDALPRLKFRAQALEEVRPLPPIFEAESQELSQWTV